MGEKVGDIFYCEYKHKCGWQGFALDRGFGMGRIENTLLAWRDAHQHYCGGKLIQAVIIKEKIKVNKG